MQCTFELKSLFASDIIKIRDDLLPLGFDGNPKQCAAAKERIGYIIDRLGQLSATAQCLNAPITSAKRLMNSQIIYLISSKDKGGVDSVVSGLLKVGPKDLYLYDELGELYQCISTPAILDFYVHGSQQRQGLGRRLIDHMLKDLGTTMCKCAVDRPSKVMMSFLAKQYGLTKSIGQTNNYIIFKGFFNGKESTKFRSSESNSKSKDTVVHKQKPQPRESLPQDIELQVPPAKEQFLGTPAAQKLPQMRKKEIDDEDHEELSMAEIMEKDRIRREANKPTSFRRTKYSL